MELENGIDSQLEACSVSTMGISCWHEESGGIEKWHALLTGMFIPYMYLVMRETCSDAF